MTVAPGTDGRPRERHDERTNRESRGPGRRRGLDRHVRCHGRFGAGWTVRFHDHEQAPRRFGPSRDDDECPRTRTAGTDRLIDRVRSRAGGAEQIGHVARLLAQGHRCHPTWHREPDLTGTIADLGVGTPRQHRLVDLDTGRQIELPRRPEWSARRPRTRRGRRPRAPGPAPSRREGRALEPGCSAPRADGPTPLRPARAARTPSCSREAPTPSCTWLRSRRARRSPRHPPPTHRRTHPVRVVSRTERIARRPRGWTTRGRSSPSRRGRPAPGSRVPARAGRPDHRGRSRFPGRPRRRRVRLDSGGARSRPAASCREPWLQFPEWLWSSTGRADRRSRRRGRRRGS